MITTFGRRARTSSMPISAVGAVTSSTRSKSASRVLHQRDARGIVLDVHDRGSGGLPSRSALPSRMRLGARGGSDAPRA